MAPCRVWCLDTKIDIWVSQARPWGSIRPFCEGYVFHVTDILDSNETRSAENSACAKTVGVVIHGRFWLRTGNSQPLT